MSKKDEFISGAWYEKQYATPGARYHEIYVKEDLPEWAKRANRFHAATAAAWLGAKPGFYTNKTPVLDLGSGVGRYMEAWCDLGYAVAGAELSRSAVKQAIIRWTLEGGISHSFSAYNDKDAEEHLNEQAFDVRGKIDRQRVDDTTRLFPTSVTDLSMFADGCFPFAFSASMFEHIDRSITKKALLEIARVAKMQAHYIPLTIGDDPSHIHIQSESEWVEEMSEALGPEHVVCCVPNYACPDIPLYLIAPKSDLPWPMAELVARARRPSK